MKEIEIQIMGMPEIVTAKVCGKETWAYINLSEIEYRIEALALLTIAVNKLSEFGFIYAGVTHSLGYYDSVEDITMTFKTKKLTHQ